MKCRHQSQTSPKNRRGAFLIIAMICLVLSSSLLGVVLRMAVLGRQQANMEAASWQAEWLAESALNRAAAKLKQQPDYTGETWELSAQELGGAFAGDVLIQVRPAKTTHQKEIAVTARFPRGEPHMAQRSKTLLVAMPAVQEASNDQTPASAEKP